MVLLALHLGHDRSASALAGPRRDQSVTRTVFDHFAQQMGVGVTNISPLLRAIEYTLDVAGGGFTLMFPHDYLSPVTQKGERELPRSPLFSCPDVRAMQLSSAWLATLSISPYLPL